MAKARSSGEQMDELRSSARIEKLELVYCQRCGKPLARVSRVFEGVIESRCPRCHNLTTFVGQLAPDQHPESRDQSFTVVVE